MIGCLISACADGGLEVHSIPLLRQPQPATFLLTYLPALSTAERCTEAGVRDRSGLRTDTPPAVDHFNATPKVSHISKDKIRELDWKIRAGLNQAAGTAAGAGTGAPNERAGRA
ncbi:hypothetical protein EVAR_51841_1 [Eumeta japonica]|uniref:Uncharacterized protein n=1 Tax=Eumeta variegata TaxID=151549 RepID=A0A4C1YTR7_EUMVA|nr:hypothetical protein EVAR_51841_1 [Eumeta japonica]